MVQLLRHRQTKGAGTDRLDLRPPRHILTLPIPDIAASLAKVCYAFEAAGRGVLDDRQVMAGPCLVQCTNRTSASVTSLKKSYQYALGFQCLTSCYASE